MDDWSWASGPPPSLRLLVLDGRLVLGVWPASLPEACHVVWTSGPGRLARLFEASWVELIAALLKATSRQPRPCLIVEREDLAQRILEETLYAPRQPPQGPR